MATFPSPLSINKVRIPAIIQWTSSHCGPDKEEHFLGLRHDEANIPSSVTMSLHFDQGEQTFSCKLPVPVKTGYEKKIHLYMTVEAAQVSQIQPALDGDQVPLPVPEHVLHHFIAEQQCLSADQVISLRFFLNKHTTLIGPASAPSLKSATSTAIVHSMLLLSQANSFTVYFPSSYVDVHTASALCARFDPTFSSNLPALDTLYNGSGGRSIRSINDFVRSTAPKASTSVPTSDHVDGDPGLMDSPPAYDHVPSSLPQPPLYQQRKGASASPVKKRKRPSDKSSQAFAISSQPESWRDAFAKQSILLAALAEKVAGLQNEMPLSRRSYQACDAAVQTVAIDMSASAPKAETSPAPPPSPCSTIEDSVTENLYVLERKLSSVLSEVAGLRSSILSEITQSVHADVDRVSRDLGERVTQSLVDIDGIGEQIDDLRTELVDHVADVESGIKVEMREYIADEMREVEARVRAKLRNAFTVAKLSVEFELSDDSDF